MTRERDPNKKSRPLLDFDADEASENPRLLEEISVQTQTIDLDSLFTRDVTSSGSFDIRGILKTTLAKLLDALPTASLLVDFRYMIFFANQALARITSEGAELMHAPFSRLFVRRSDWEKAAAALDKISRNRKPQVVEGILGSERTRIWARMHMRSLRMESERFTLVLIEDLTHEKREALLSKKYAESLKKARDELDGRVLERTAELVKANEELRSEIAQRKSAEENLNLAANVIASSNEAIFVTDRLANIVDVNEAFCQITGYSRDDALGKNPRIMASGRHDREFWKEFWTTLVKTGHWRGEVWDRRKNGEVFPKLLSVSAIKGSEAMVTHYVGIFSDITQIKQSEERLEQLAHYDPLTQLPNRLLFRDRLNRALTRASRQKNMVALMFVDLDGFKNVNDTFGHPRGDDLLSNVALRLTQCVRGADTVARLGGDEFTVIVPDVADVRQVISVAERIMRDLSRPFVLDGEEIFTGASIGISLYPKDAADTDRMLQHADTAMYHAKSQGRNRFQFFSEEMNIEISKYVMMETTLRRAMEVGGLLVYYQPVLECRTGKIISAEALLRVRTPSGDVVSAGPHIQVAEERGLIVPIGKQVLRTACEQNKLWQFRGFSPICMAVNVSMRQLREPNLVDTVLEVLQEVDHSPRYLELELTETSLIANMDVAVRNLNELRRHGVKVALDDFGTGYSSLSYLRNLPVDTLKIDKSFVQGISSDPATKAMIQAMVTVAHSLDMKVVAEGVESDDQLRVLCDLDCDAWQGHLRSHAVPADDFERLLSVES
jgi:diguanylate cyclase (GGDEF)-like protein/PAS domain S-box-containing protein